MKKIFEYLSENLEGYSGLLEINAPDEFNPGTPLTIAHDCIEHFKGDDGSCTKEFMAFGAMLYIRGKSGYLNSSYFTMAQAMASDLAIDVWRHYNNGSALKAHEILKYSSDIEEIAKETKKLIITENDYEYEDLDHDKLKLFLEGLKYWIHIGYKKAKKKYPNQSNALYLFTEIENQLSKIYKHLEPYDLVEISWNYLKSKINIKHIPSWERKELYY